MWRKLPLYVFLLCNCRGIACLPSMVGWSTHMAASLFSRAALCCLTWNSLGTEVSCVRCADDVRMMRGRHADNTRVRLRWRFGLADDICRPDIIRTSSAGGYIICMSSTHAHIIHTLSASHPHHSSWSAWAWTIFYCDRNLLLNGIFGKNVELFHFRIM